jgi:hypothetical protein
MALIKICPNCDRRNAAGNETCEFCDMPLASAEPFDAPALTAPRVSVSGHLLALPLQVELLIGRSGEGTSPIPDIDLAPFGGTAAAGVSRRHARLIWNGVWQIEDMGSANGTLVNKERLTGGEPLTLSNNAVIQIGKLYLVFHG